MIVGGMGEKIGFPIVGNAAITVGLNFRIQNFEAVDAR